MKQHIDDALQRQPFQRPGKCRANALEGSRFSKERIENLGAHRYRHFFRRKLMGLASACRREMDFCIMDRETRLKRLYFRAWHRGTKEADLLIGGFFDQNATGWNDRSEEHTSELQSLMRISYAVLCLKKKK